MLTRSSFAQRIDGPAVDREIERLSKMGGGWIAVASVLSRRINWTVDWESLGPSGAPYRIVGSRGEAVLFWDDKHKNRIIKLRGQSENGFGDAGFGCILKRDDRGRIGYAPGTLAQALEREQLSWEHLGFGCRAEDVLENECGLLLSQDFIHGTAPTLKEIETHMLSQGWQRVGDDVLPTLRTHAWRRRDIGAFDANETNFVKCSDDGKLYPIDLIIWHWPH